MVVRRGSPKHGTHQPRLQKAGGSVCGRCARWSSRVSEMPSNWRHNEGAISHLPDIIQLTLYLRLVSDMMTCPRSSMRVVCRFNAGQWREECALKATPAHWIRPLSSNTIVDYAAPQSSGRLPDPDTVKLPHCHKHTPQRPRPSLSFSAKQPKNAL